MKMEVGNIKRIRTELLLGASLVVLVFGVGASSFFATQQITKWQLQKALTNPATVKGQQTQKSTLTSSVSPSPTDIMHKTSSSNKALPRSTQIPPISTLIPTSLPPSPTSQPQIDTEFLDYLNNYKAKTDAEIILNASNLSRYESERQQMINGYISDGLTPPSWYLETTSRIINNTQARIETLKGLRSKWKSGLNGQKPEKLSQSPK